MNVNLLQVSSIEGFIETGKVNKEFIALILLPIVGKAAEIVCQIPDLERPDGLCVQLPGNYRHGLIQESLRSFYERGSEFVYSGCPLRHPIFGAARLDYRTAVELM